MRSSYARGRMVRRLIAGIQGSAAMAAGLSIDAGAGYAVDSIHVPAGSGLFFFALFVLVAGSGLLICGAGLMHAYDAFNGERF